MEISVQAVADILRAIAWPAVAVVAGVYFRREIRDLARRLRKGGGAEFDPLPQATSGPANPLLPPGGSAASAISRAANTTLEAFPRTPATVNWEAWLVQSDALREVAAPDEREKVLLRMLARAMLVNQFEQTEGSIWASQLDLLAYLNSRRSGESKEQAKALFYDRAAAQFPSWYERYDFDGWLTFLRRYSLVIVNDDAVAITPEGIEYLAWRVQQGRPPKLQG